MNIQFLRLRAVRTITGLSRSTIYAMQTAGTFPKSISIGARAIAWSSLDIETWMNSRITASRATKESLCQVAVCTK